jgi:hypothetical protein
MFHGIWGVLNGVFHKSIPSAIPTLQPPKLYCFIDFITRTAHVQYLLWECKGRYKQGDEKKELPPLWTEPQNSSYQFNDWAVRATYTEIVSVT